MLTDLEVRASLGEVIRRGSNGNLDEILGKDYELMMLREERSREVINRERDLNIYRSGSAPPTVEGSLNAVGSLFRNSNNTNFLGIDGGDNVGGNGVLSEEEIRSHPAYLSYYYSNENLNPRLPPPLLSKEDWRVAQRFQTGTSSYGGIGDRRKEFLDDGSSRSLFSLQPGHLGQNGDGDFVEPRKVTPRNLTRQPSAEWLEKDTDGLIGLAGVGLGARRKSLADMLQEGLGRSMSKASHLSRPSSRNALDDVVDPMGVSELDLTQLHNKEPLDKFHSGTAAPGMVRVQSLGSSISQSFASVVGSSLSRSTTPEAPLVGRSSAYNLPPLAGRAAVTEKKNASGGLKVYNGLTSGLDRSSDISDTLSELTLSKSRLIDENNQAQSQMESEFSNQRLRFDMPNGHTKDLQQLLVDKSGSKIPNVSTIYEQVAKTSGIATDHNISKVNIDEQVNFPRRPSSANMYTQIPSAGSPSLEGSSLSYQIAETENINLSGYNPSGYSVNQRFNPSMANHLDAGSTMSGIIEEQSFNRSGNHVGPGFQVPMDPLYVQYLHRTSDFASQLNDFSLGRNYMGTSQADLIVFQKAYLAALLLQQKQQYNIPFLDKSDGLNPGYYGSPTFGGGMPYPGNVMASSVHPSGSGSPMRQNERITHFPSMIRSSAGGSWHSYDGGNMDESCTSSLLEEFKNNKTRCFELSEIADHVVEFRYAFDAFVFCLVLLTYRGLTVRFLLHVSADQYGSRFIQQKLETATVEEKNKIFPEIIPHAQTLMTDVFGNYVIQKFFEHGTDSQRKELASQLTGHVLPLSLQMYGCRVIQKNHHKILGFGCSCVTIWMIKETNLVTVPTRFGTHIEYLGVLDDRSQLLSIVIPINKLSLPQSANADLTLVRSSSPLPGDVMALEVVDVGQQTQMVAELDGSIMKCVRDQNGNHVIQKCIECVPQDRIQFIVSSFYGQVVALSTHPYGCRVIQRVLEHCDDEDTQRIIMEEILKSVCTLAQDQYGNYVIQHVLQHGKPHERSVIIGKLAGQIVKMSQQKFASNVVEKCLTFGGSEERQLLVNEMLGSTDENEPLQVMMKDPYGNYVVQKVLETCDNQSRELILSRIKVHLTALKKYTYGKHIVARVEKLITTGERRMGISSSFMT
ncbi:hypothetical protein IFM89_025920 [Coptis chinensis]|uniref:PUM-HD domain-containing protein n=1 Tax=Coptis chinensis TaxID=261450 RepID=A0A835HGZ7_9MAGN|nr:hypothetical protein IFM89_025920 [Coptis chinensis]